MHIKSYCENSYLIENIFNSLHVDELLTIEGTDDEAVKFYISVKSCLAAANFNLRKFSSNSKKLENLLFYRRKAEIVWVVLEQGHRSDDVKTKQQQKNA